MIRTGWLAALALAALSPLTSFGQQGGMGMGMGMGMGGGMGGGGMGGGGMGGGGMGGGGMGMAMGMGGAPFVPPGAEEWTVKIETTANQAVTGRLKLAAIAVHCELGLYEIKPDRIKEVQFNPMAKDAPGMFGMMGAQRDAVVMTASGEKIAGTVSIPQWWRVRTELGMLMPDAQRIKSLTFVARVEPEPGQKPGQMPQANGGGQPGGQKPNSSKPSGQPGPNKPGPETTEAPK